LLPSRGAVSLFNAWRFAGRFAGRIRFVSKIKVLTAII
jgi:hypothetical protein